MAPREYTGYGLESKVRKNRMEPNTFHKPWISKAYKLTQNLGSNSLDEESATRFEAQALVRGFSVVPCIQVLLGRSSACVFLDIERQELFDKGFYRGDSDGTRWRNSILHATCAEHTKKEHHHHITVFCLSQKSMYMYFYLDLYIHIHTLINIPKMIPYRR